MENKRTQVYIGIDTGGTFTDGVAVDVETGEILQKSKANTTKDDLSIGIAACIGQLRLSDQDFDIVSVCISTTLATNAAVEGRLSRVGLMITGNEELNGKLVVDRWRRVSGNMSITGEILEELDEEEVMEAAGEMKGKIDCLVISGYASVRNPHHELRIKELVKDFLDVPVICAHELSLELGFHERTATAVLNAHLMPVISDLLRKTKQALQEKGINAEIIVIKGDGTMMTERYAAERPIETVLSGPAASVVGGAYLTDVEDAFVVDLGGTTMDIADMGNGRVSITEKGATVNGWQTKVKAVDIHTFGLGGDSRLREDGKGLSFGPRKAIPICYAASRYPGLLDEILDDAQRKAPLIHGFSPVEGLALTQRMEGRKFSDLENRIITLLEDGPHGVSWLAERLNVAQRRLGIDSLINKGVISIISITPTDLLHVTGEFRQWDAEASIACMKILADRRGITTEALTEQLTRRFVNQMTFALIHSAFWFDSRYNEEILKSPWMYDAVFGEGKIGLKPMLHKKIVALGAPAQAWLTRLSQQLATEVVLPPHAEVANAIGAVKGVISEVVEVMIRYDANFGEYRIYMPWAMHKEEAFDDAYGYAMKQIDEHIAVIEKERGMDGSSRTKEESYTYRSSASEESEEVYEAKIRVVLSGRPMCFRSR